MPVHLPHSFFRKYLSKAENGYHHSKAFTFQDFHEPIMITAKSAGILQENCLNCHGGLVHEQIARAADGSGEVRCVHCHRSVGHGETAGLGRREAGNNGRRNAHEKPSATRAADRLILVVAVATALVHRCCQHLQRKARRAIPTCA